MTEKDIDKLRDYYGEHVIQEIYTRRFYEIGWMGKKIWDVIKWRPIKEREHSLEDVFDYYEGVKDLLDILKLNKKRKIQDD